MCSHATAVKRKKLIREFCGKPENQPLTDSDLAFYLRVPVAMLY